jgi:signal transduction histidine kinase
MKVTLYSEDVELHRLCSEILSAFAGSAYQLSLGKPDGSLPGSDLTIWDFSPELSLPESLGAEVQYRHLFVVRRRHLTALQGRVLPPAARILLKPCNYVTLSAFMEENLRQCNGAPDEGRSRIGSLAADRDELMQSLIVTNLRLQEYDQDRTAFLTRTVHDFRAPLTALSGYCGLMLAGQLGSLTEEQKDVLQRMLHSSKRLSRMADAMFELGLKHQRDDLGPTLAPGDIRCCIDQAMHELIHTIRQKSLLVSVDIGFYSEPLHFDSQQIEQVFVNLLDNACRFTPRGGSIEIRAYPYFWDRRDVTQPEYHPNRRESDRAVPNCLRVDVCDSGPGIPPGQLEKIFEEYTSYSGSQDRSCGGLGLAICKMIANRHRGRIWAEARSQGAMFSFVLPFYRPN